ncbi:MAG: galactokinase [Bacteroidales bacterium]|nr:galactokinase [Bacteroidales bacterium]
MLEIIRQCFKQHFTANGKLYAAPGRINLIGEHTDYNLGFVLPGAIDKSFYMMVAPNGTQVCNVFSPHFNAMVSFNVDDTDIPEAQWSRYVYGEVKELQALGCKIGGFDAVVASDIPIGAGISSSAAFTTVTGVALNDLFDLGLNRMQLAKAGQMCEHHYVGVRCGIMDQFASLHGEEGKLIRLDCRSLEYQLVPFSPQGLKIVLLDTLVKHSLASSEYNLRRADCEAGVAHLKQSYPHIESLRDVTMEMLEAHRSEVTPVVYNRCSFVIEENQRLLDACAALEQGDYKSVGLYMYGSHHGLSKKYEVSCPELDLIQEVAQKHDGVLGARMMGGGFGGCTINLVQEEAVEDFILACKERYNKKLWKELRPIEVAIGSGARIIS